MSKPLVFISCGQFTTAEKTLGKSIYDMVDSLGMQPFFAEQVQDLNGLNENILNNLRDCAGFITILHPRGTIKRPDRSFERASVWIEQEIGIAAYIMHVEKRQMPVIAFIHKSVGREGIRDLLHLNPVEFTDEMEILAKLPARLHAWGTLQPTGLVPQISIAPRSMVSNGHTLRYLQFSLINNTDFRISQLSGRLRVPTGILKHHIKTYAWDQEQSTDQRYTIFRFTEKNVHAIAPQSTGAINTFEYCIDCAIDDTKDTDHIGGLIVGEYEVEFTVWVDGKRYDTLTTVRRLQESRWSGT